MLHLSVTGKHRFIYRHDYLEILYIFIFWGEGGKFKTIWGTRNKIHFRLNI